MYGYLAQDELYHYGVMGMKWGVRKQQPTSRFTRRDRRDYVRKLRAQQNLRQIDKYRAINRKKQFDSNRAIAKKYAGNDKKIIKKQAYNNVKYQQAEVNNRFAIERNKYFMDRSHKNSESYKKAKAAWSKQLATNMLVGSAGQYRISELKSRGMTSKAATLRTVGEEAVAGFLSGAAAGAIWYYTSKR